MVTFSKCETIFLSSSLCGVRVDSGNNAFRPTKERTRYMKLEVLFVIAMQQSNSSWRWFHANRSSQSSEISALPSLKETVFFP
jgi:hypothetical protein